MDEKKGQYQFSEIENKWQGFWESKKTFRADDCDKTRPKYYVLDMFPYPSGQGLHVGHPEGYTASDIVARYKRMKGFNVLHPMGWDAFGLPAEQYAVQTGTHPAETTQKNIDNIRRQIKSLGFSYDWDREVNTTDAKYYKWTQWIFLKLFNSYFDEAEQKAKPIDQLPVPEGLSEQEKQDYIDEHRLAYQAEAPVNWCPELGTVLANEEVVGGLSERGGHPVVRKPMRQWMLRITKYCERLLEGLKDVDWSSSIKKLQQDWIGKSIGADVDFKVDRYDETIRVFTTRPDTLFGATYMVMSPEHPLVDVITTDEYKDAVEKYREAAAGKSDLDRTDLAKEKTGQFTGAYAINPVNEEKIPIWISDYVLISYGTGAIMAVPAHDERDFEFAMKFGIPILPVVDCPDGVTKSFALAGTMKDGLAEALQAENIPFTKDGDSLYITIPQDKIDRYIELVQTFLLPGSWNEVLGGRWIFIFDDGIWSWDSLVNEKRILERCKEIVPDLSNKRTLMEMLWECEFYRDILYHDQYGTMIHSGPFSGTDGDVACKNITAWLAEKGLGNAAINYKLRDWLFSRQRYWGEPFPIVHTEAGRAIALSEDDLPLTLPEVENYKPSSTGEPPLGNAGDWLEVILPDGTKGIRETNTMPQWAGSCWYYLRYLDPDNDGCLCDPEKEKYWLNVDLYIGGAEHAVLHLLYSRFWHMLLYDLGYVSCPEPYGKLINQGMILGQDSQKMSKSRGNVVNPDKVIADYGADSMRLYEMFMGPLEATKPWNTQGVEGVHRFLQRVWRMIIDQETGEVSQGVTGLSEKDASEQTIRLLHQTIKKVGDDIEKFGFNTAISQMMIFVNQLSKEAVRPKSVIEKFLLVLSSFAPHIAEELWEKLGHNDTLAYENWPGYDSELIREKEIELAVQVKGKIKDRIVVPADATEEQIKEKALASEKVIAALAGKEPKKVIVIKSRLVNIVI